MTRFTFSSKELNALQKVGAREIRTNCKSPFAIVNTLNRIARGDLNKVDGCGDLDFSAVCAIARTVKCLHTNKRYAFILDVFAKNAAGQFCEVVTPAKGTYQHIYLRMNDETPAVRTWCDSRGYELTENGTALKPIQCTEVGFFNAFSRLVKKDAKETEKAAKEAAKEAKKTAKEAAKLEKAKKAMRAVFGEYAETLSDSELLAKFEAIRKKVA